MNPFAPLAELNQVQSSYLLLGMLAGLALLAAVLYKIGVIGWVLRVFGRITRTAIRHAFLVWKALLSWASWPIFLVLVLAILLLGGLVPALRLECGLAPLLMGAVTCLAYMFIDLERYEVERGYKAVHNPLKGQDLAIHLARYGQQVRVPLLAAATVAAIGGFAMLNLGLYESFGTDWYRVADHRTDLHYVDFVVYAVINLLSVVDVLDLADTNHLLHAAFVHQARWPAAVLLAGFKAFFTLVLLQQIFASLRQGKLLTETITDFWSPHDPIHERARNALPQYGSLAIGPLLVSLRSAPTLTKEQRDQLPAILATIGPSTIPTLIRHLHDRHEHVRAIVVTALGQLHALEAIPRLAALASDASDLVRQSVAEALGVLCGAGVESARKISRLGPRRGHSRPAFRWFISRKKEVLPAPPDPVELALKALETALSDPSVSVRLQATLAASRIGAAAGVIVPSLVLSLKDADETVRCQAAEALGRIGGDSELTVAALVEMLPDASAAVKAAAARALGALKKVAAPAVSVLVPLLQDRDESVRTAAAEAIAQVGPLEGAAAESLVEGLSSSDNVVRAQTAEALGTIGVAAADAAPALVEAMTDDNDRVRSAAVEALGKIGESAADIAVPGLVQALHDHDNEVSALAAEALGQMGESADGAIPALVRSLTHQNPQVRANAAEALGKMGAVAVGARSALEGAVRDEDGGVRGEVLRALGAIGPPTPESLQAVDAGLADADPLVRTAAVEAVGQWGDAGDRALPGLVGLLEDANDDVKLKAIQVLPKLAGATPAVIEGLCRRLLEDDNPLVQVQAALALGQLGEAAAAAGGALLQIAQTGEVSVRDQAMRAIAMIQPPETTQAFTAGLKDASASIRMVASAGWMNAASIPEEAIPALIEALRDPEAQVRANAAHALARLDALPSAAVPLLIECTADANDGLRMNAAMALKLAPTSSVDAVMRHLVADPNSRVRLIAAGRILAGEPTNAAACAVLTEALEDPALRVRKSALEFLESLDVAGGTSFQGALAKRAEQEGDPELKEIAGGLANRFLLFPIEGADGL